MNSHSDSWIDPAIRVAAAGLGAAVAGPAERASDPEEARLSTLLAAGDLDAALVLKTKQVEIGINRRAEQTDRLARDQFELGNIHELRSEWQKALEAYREA